MFRNQYLITKNPVINSTDFYTHSDKDIYIHKSVPFAKVEINDSFIGMIRTALNPSDIELKNENILSGIDSQSNSLTEIINFTSNLTGRFIVYCRIKNKRYVFGDAFNSKQVYYYLNENKFFISSSEKLILYDNNEELETREQFTSFINSYAFKSTEHSLYGERSLDKRIKKLLPNHYLDLTTEKISRIDYTAFSNDLSYKELVKYCSFLLSNTYDALSHRNENLIQPLTAGWDSRLLLAASKNVTSNIKYYVFNPSKHTSEIHQDVDISNKLAKKNNLNFQVFHTNRLDATFVQEFNKNHLLPRIMDKTAEIQYLQNNFQNSTINLNGNGGEVLRKYYGTGTSNVTLSDLILLTKYSNSDIFKEELDKWLYYARTFSYSTNIPILDLFYWEQRMGHWGALYPFELDLAMEQVSPFNNRNFIYTALTAHPSKLKGLQYTLFKDIIKFLWPELLLEPINPKDSYLKNIIKSKTRLRLLIQKMTTHYGNEE